MLDGVRRGALIVPVPRAQLCEFDERPGYAFKKFARSPMKASACSRSHGSFV